MEKRTLGRSGLEVSVLSLGCWALAGGAGWGDQAESEAIAAIHAALDHGINFLDTAEGYGAGRSEEIVGKALIGRRDQAIVATKISPSNADPVTLRETCEDSLRRLQTDYIDLYIVHWPITAYPVADAFAALEGLQREGKIRAIGVSNHGVEQLTEALATGTQIDCNQLCYSLLSRAIEFEILPLCREREVSVTAYMPLLQGLLTGKYRTIDDVPPFHMRTRHFSSDREGARHSGPGAEDQVFASVNAVRAIAEELGEPMANVALAWVMAQPGLASAIAGARRPDQVARNVQAAALKLSPDVIVRLNAATDALKQTLGPNADLWEDADKTRTR